MKTIILSCLCVLSSYFAAAQINLQDRQVLLDLYNATNGSEWNRPWDLASEVSAWQGVTVENDRVTEISLLFNNLVGRLPASLGNLEHLKKLELSFNRISGEIPAELGKLQNLEILAINGADLEGNIPSEIGGLSNLRELHLSSNQLTGTVPNSLGNLKSIEVFNLFDNQLFGALPSQLASSPNLRELMVAKNNFSNPTEFSVILLANSATLILDQDSSPSDTVPNIIAVEREEE